nr:transposase [Altericroceibacterium xinjiangense]
MRLAAGWAHFAKRRAVRIRLTAPWRAVDHEGEVLESYVTKTRDKAAALRFMRALSEQRYRIAIRRTAE